MSILHHPPDELADDRFRLQFGVYVHEGVTPAADVEQHYQCYVHPVETEVLTDAVVP